MESFSFSVGMLEHIGPSAQLNHSGHRPKDRKSWTLMHKN